jgi:hypothetical protein
MGNLLTTSMLISGRKDVSHSAYPRFLIAQCLLSGGSTASPLTRSPNGTFVDPELSLSRRPSVVDVPGSDSSLGSLRRSPAPSAPASRASSPPGFIANPGDRRGRRSSRFSLSSVLGDAIQLNATRFSRSRDSPHEDESNHLSRGRLKERGRGVANMTTSVAGRQGSRDQSTLKKIGTLLKLDYNENEACDDWKEFKKGS